MYKCNICNNTYATEYGLKVHTDKQHLPPRGERLAKVGGTHPCTLDITNEQLEEYRKTHTKCEICGKDINEIRNENNRFKQLCIDHNHKTNEFRGLLCMTCNSALGWFEKNNKSIEKYLNDKGKQNKNS